MKEVLSFVLAVCRKEKHLIIVDTVSLIASKKIKYLAGKHENINLIDFPVEIRAVLS